MNDIFQAFLYIATLFETLVFGWILLFVIVVMPGIAKLDDGAFLRAFQVIDGVIQDNQPIFVFVWIGSAVALITTCVLGWIYLEDDEGWQTDKILLTVATMLFILVQYMTFTKNIPLNNRVQSLKIDQMDAVQKTNERLHFEASWNFWNMTRTVVAWIVTMYLFSLLLRV